VVAEVEPADYLMFWELPLSVRQSLPPLGLSLHVYTPDEAGRFVLVNGQRHQQGDRIAREVEVVEIRPDGAILEFRGYRFLLRR
jgi:general secretion pathway protein B